MPNLDHLPPVTSGGTTRKPGHTSGEVHGRASDVGGGIPATKPAGVLLGADVAARQRSDPFPKTGSSAGAQRALGAAT